MAEWYVDYVRNAERRGTAPIQFAHLDTYGGFGGYIVMMWYKERGRVGNAVFMTDDGTEPLTLEHAEIAIKTAERWLRND